MLRTPWIVPLLRVGLVAATVWLTVRQAFSLPGSFAQDAGPEDAHVRIPAQVVAVIVLSALPVLLMAVMRGLLRQASCYRSELVEVI